jgi:hypothetical protein
VGLRLERAAGFEVLANPAHRRAAVAEAGGDLGRAFALLVELNDALANRNGDALPNRSLPTPIPNTLRHLCKRSIAQQA